MHFLSQLFELLFFPPGLFILLLLLSILLIKNLRQLKFFLMIQILLMYIFSIPITSDYLFSQLETIPALNEEQIVNNKVDAIVVLAGGITAYSKEYHRPDIGFFTQIRLRYAAWLHKKTALPIIVTGGIVRGGVTEAELMRQVLQNEYAIKAPIWVEKQSQNTYENSLYSSKILTEHQYQNYYLVTSAFHMPRALAVFKQHHKKAIPAPMGFYYNPGTIDSGYFKPHSRILWENYLALHETIGRYWYQIYYQ